MSGKPRFLVGHILLLSFLYSCSHGQKVSTLKLEEAMKREASELSGQKVLSKDNFLTFAVAAKTPPTVELFNEKVPYYYARIDIGSITPIECFFYNTDMNAALTLKGMVDTALGNEKTLGKITKREVAFFGASAVSAYPVLFLNINYANDKQEVGYLKALVGTKEAGSVVCLHNEVGYNNTMGQRFGEVLASFQFKVPAARAQYTDLLLLSIQNLPIGFIQNRVIEGEDGSKFWVSKSSVLFAGSDGKVSTYDSSEGEVTSKDGKLLQGRYNMENDLDSSHSIQIASADGRSYVVKGFQNAKYISEKMTTPGLVSHLQHSRLLVKKLYGEGLRHFSVPIYSPVEKVDGTVKLRTSLKSKQDDGAMVRMDSGGVVTTALVDREGMIEEASFPVGPEVMKAKRVFRQGSIAD